MRRPTFLSAALLCASAWAQSTNPNYVAYTGYSFRGSPAVAPGQIITLFVRGLNVPNAVADKIPLPTTLSGVTVTVKNPPTPSYPTSLPIFSVRSFPSACSGGGVVYCDTTAVTVQIPFDSTVPPCTSPNPHDCILSSLPGISLVVQAQGSAGQAFSLGLDFQAPHILNTCDTLFVGVRFGKCVPIGNGLEVCEETVNSCFPLITHGDGTFVRAVAPARPGETITLYAVGLGPTRNAKTGQAVASPDPVAGDIYLTYAVTMGTPPGSPAPPLKYVGSGKWIKADYAGLVQGFVGLYQINVRLPDRLPEGTRQCEIVRLMLGLGAADGGFSNTDSAELYLCQ